MIERPAHTCQSCGHPFQGRYCPSCGEKVHTESHKKVSHLLEEAVHFVTHLDGSLFTTLRALFTAPGKLSYDFCRGVRKKYFKPLSLYLLLVVGYLLFPKFQGLNMKFATYVNPQYNTRWYALEPARQKIRTHQITAEELARRYDKQSATIAKPFLFLLIPLTGLLLYGLLFWRRSYLYDHLVVSAELNSYFIGLNFLLMPFLMWLTEKWYPPGVSVFYDGGAAGIVSQVITGIITALLARRFYSLPWYGAILLAAAFSFAGFELIQYLYRLLLYFTVMLFI